MMDIFMKVKPQKIKLDETNKNEILSLPYSSFEYYTSHN